MNILQFFKQFDKLQLILIALLFLAFIFIVFQQKKTYVGGVLGEKAYDIDKQPTLTPIPSATPSPTNVLLTPTVTIAPTKNPTPTITSQSSSSDLIYPGASITSSDNGSTRLESSDDPDKITDWYKEKIRAMGMSSKSFVATKTNGNVLNKLVGADGSREVRVEIEKKADESKTHISVTSTGSI